MMTPENPPQEQQNYSTTGEGTTTPSQQGGASGGSSTPGSGSNDKVCDPTRDIAERLALAEAMKPVEAASADLYAADKQKARDALSKAYDKAVGPDGELRRKFDKAHKRFDDTAADMAKRLDDWVKRVFGKGAVGQLLDDRKDVEKKLDGRTGDNERGRSRAQTKTKRWADAHANWSSPVDKMSALIGEYSDKIEKLNADINNNVSRDAQILSFWFEVAPKHLQLSDKDLSTEAQQALKTVKAAVNGYPDLKKKLEFGSTRNDGSLYLISAGKLGETRRDVLDKWIAAAKAQATAEGAFKVNPDDTATLKQRWDKLKDDFWIKDAKSALEPPAA